MPIDTLLRSGSITLYLLFAVALGALLYLFVDLAQRQVTGSFQFVWIGICLSWQWLIPEKIDLILIHMGSRGKHATAAFESVGLAQSR
ncbi:hypothetical protein [Paraburkholderia sp. 35.1]|uniref:hypothetical protein n=1 Tax=Paraburkholderia sp. 35.1 TaxID=2991058 RepID=UPI003D1FCF1C